MSRRDPATIGLAATPTAATFVTATFLAAIVLASCAPPAAQIVVLVDAEPAVREDARYHHVRVQIRGHNRQDGVTVERPTLLDEEVVPGTGQVPWPFRLVLTPEGGDASRTYEVLVRAENGADVPFVEARAISGYVPGETRVLTLTLTRACVGVPACPPDQTCRTATCESAAVEAATLPGLNGPRDAGMDAATPPPDASEEDAPAMDTGVDARGALDGTVPVDAGGPIDAFSPVDAGPRSPFMPTGVVAHTGTTDNGLLGSSVAVSATGDWYAATEPGTMRVRSFLGGDALTVAVGGPTTRDLIIGASADARAVALGMPATLTNAGHVEVYEDAGSSLVLDAPLTTILLAEGDRFGEALAVSADGAHLAVGAPGYGGSGAVFLFRSTSAEWLYVRTLVAPSAGAGDQFGASVAISDDGATVVVGAPSEDTLAGGLGATPDDDGNRCGAVYVFSSSDRFVTDLSVVFVKAETPTNFEQFGHAVAVDASGDSVVVGVLGSFAPGRAELLVRNGPMWGFDSILTASNAEDGDMFGYSVDISADGEVIAVGAPLEDSGPNPMGVSTTFDAMGTDSGAVYVFEPRLDDRQVFLKPPTADFNGAHLGTSVAISYDGRVVVSGAPHLSGSTTNAGAVLAFR